MPGTVTKDNPATSQADDPAERECLRCYLCRVLKNRTCDGTRTWTTHWSRRRAPRDSELLRRIEHLGGCCCDCEVLLNVWEDGDLWEERETDEIGPCSGTTHEDPLVPCETWSPHPETLIRQPWDDEYDPYSDADAYRSYSEECW